MTDTKILIIDDDSGITEGLKSYFESNDTLENAEVQPTLTQEEQ